MLNMTELVNGTFNPRISACLALLLLTTGCASLKKGDCLEGDWGGIGFRDGAAGYDSSTRLARHTKACGKHGVTPDHALYKEGHEQGLETFCTTPEGYTYGSKAAEYRGICPVALEKDFLKGYTEGLKRAQDNIDDELYRLDDQKDNAQYRYARLARRDDTDAKELRNARDRVEDIKSRILTGRQERRKIRRMLDVWTARLLEGV